MKSPVRLAVAALAAAAMIVGVAAPAAAQETLGFEVDKTEGFPGEIVNGQVNVADVAAHCVTDVEEFMARFAELLTDPDLYNFGQASGELFDRFFPTGDFDFETHEQLAYVLVGFAVIGLSGFIGPEPAEEALPQTFVMTFADIATEEPVGELGNFDPDTGQGSVVVPDVDPGLWAVAAACVGPTFDIDELEAGIRASGPFLEELGAPPDWTSPEFIEWAQDFLDSDSTDSIELVIELLGEIGPTLLQPIMVPDALGFQLFTVLSDEEEVVDEEVDDAAVVKAVAKAVVKVTINIIIQGVDADDVRVKLDEAGVEILTAAPAAAPAAQAVEAAPTFTG
jgi:hypothetical protein